uniref:Uncharacterized protein n=1 Tax=Oryza brachyantha TaxID=4533 RepID=J3MWH7_ORYBR
MIRRDLSVCGCGCWLVSCTLGRCRSEGRRSLADTWMQRNSHHSGSKKKKPNPSAFTNGYCTSFYSTS